MSELGNISERRHLPTFIRSAWITAIFGCQARFKFRFYDPQYTAASIVNQNKQLCTPASIDSIESSKGQEDHVRMGANAATKAFRVMENLERILAIELFNAAQAFHFRRPLKTSPFLENFYESYRKKVDFIET